MNEKGNKKDRRKLKKYITHLVGQWKKKIKKITEKLIENFEYNFYCLNLMYLNEELSYRAVWSRK